MRKNLLLDNSIILISIIIIVLVFFRGTPLTNENNNSIMLRTDPDPNGYYRIYDSISMIEHCKDFNRTWLGNATFHSAVGVSTIAMPTCGENPITNAPLKEFHYLVFPGYEIKDDAFFLIHDDRYYIKYVQPSGVDSLPGHYETKEVGIRYVFPNPKMYNSDAGYLLFPISKSSSSILKVILEILGYLFAAIWIIYVVLRPAQTVWDISKGKVFTNKNVRNLHQAALVLFAFAIAPSLLQLIIYVFLKSKIPAEIHLSFLEILSEHNASLIAGIIMLIIARAFARGLTLQKQNLSTP